MFIYFSDQMWKRKSNKSFKSSLCWLFGEILHKWVNRSNIVACPHHHFLLAFNFVHRAPNSVRLRNRNKGTKAPKPFNIYISTKYEGARRSNNCNKSPKYLKQIVHLHSCRPTYYVFHFVRTGNNFDHLLGGFETILCWTGSPPWLP